VELVFFWILAFVALSGSALLVFFFRNPVYGAISLIVSLLAMAGLFVLLDAHFLGAIQVMVYAGAIMVLFLFVTMLLNLQDHELGGPRWSLGKVASAGAAGFITWRLAAMLMRTDGPIAGFDVTTLPINTLENIGTIEGVGRLLFSKYLLPFEITSVLILAAIVASVVIAKKEL
jgi:NADH-quinone oxidoreductase subunit J